MNKLDLGAVSAYAMAKEKGYEGTEEEFATLMAESGDNALRAEEAKDRAEEILESIPLDYQEAVQGVVALTEKIAVSPFVATQFVIPSKTEHSSKNDQLKANIKAGDEYRVIFDNGIVYAYYSDGENEPLSGTSPITAIAKKDIVAFGVYMGNTSDDAVTVRLTVANQQVSDLYGGIAKTSAVFTSDVPPKKAYFESAGSSGVYVKIDGNLYIRGFSADADVVWSTHFANSLVTSPNGVKNCLYIPHNCSLVYNRFDRKYSVANGFVPTDKSVAIFKVGYGDADNDAQDGVIGGIGLWYYLEWLFTQKNSVISSRVINLPLSKSEFVIQAGAEHSSLKDQLEVNIKAGDEYAVTFNYGLLYAYYSDGTSEPLTSISPAIGTAAKNIAAFGIYNLNSTNASMTVSMTVATGNALVNMYRDILPEYWENYLSIKIPEAQQNIDNSALSGDSFAFFTDYHIENNSGFSHLILQKIKEETGLADVVFGGDVFNGSPDRNTALGYIREFRKRFSNVNLYGIRGNHEYNLNDGGSTSVMLSESEIYSNLVRGIEDKVNVTNMHYYKDNDNKKLRYIFLDAKYENEDNYIDDEQIGWMEDRIRELEDSWGVIVFTHQLFAANASPGKAITQNPGYNVSGEKILNAMVALKNEVSATIIGIISGHAHFDYSTNEHGFLEIATTCDGRFETGGLDQTSGTTNEHAIDVFSVDPAKRTIKTVRIGRGTNREWTY